MIISHMNTQWMTDCWNINFTESKIHAIYTRSQKKRTMNSLACLATQGQGQVTPAGSYLHVLKILSIAGEPWII